MFDQHHMVTTDEYSGLAKVLFESQSKGLTGSAYHGQYSNSQAICIVYPVIREVDMRLVTSSELLSNIMNLLEM
jgi:hypothetical protein